MKNHDIYICYLSLGIEAYKASQIELFDLDCEFDKAINPTSKAAYYMKGKALQFAIEFFDKAIHLNPTSTVSYYMKGKALFESGNIEAAQEIFAIYRSLAQQTI